MKRFGMAYIRVDGELLETMPGASIDIGGVERNNVDGDNEVLGFSERPVPAVIECEISMGPHTSLEKIRQITDATVTFECDTGQKYVCANAWVSNTLKATSGEGGKVPVVITSRRSQPIE